MSAAAPIRTEGIHHHGLVVSDLDRSARFEDPDDTFHRVDHAAKRLGVSRSEFFARAAEKALDALDDDGTTDAINRAIAGLPADHAFTDAAAAALAASDQR